MLRKLDGAALLNQQTRIAMLLVALTACRKSEIIEGRWSEIDLAAAECMKAKRPYWTPLSKQAVALLHQLRKLRSAGTRIPFSEPARPEAPDG